MSPPATTTTPRTAAKPSATPEPDPSETPAPALPAGRRRSRNRGWGAKSKAPRKVPESLSAPPQPSQRLPPLVKGAEVEVRLDDDGFHGSWFEATVEGFINARGRLSARYAVSYTHLLADDSGSALVEHFPPFLIRPRPPASAAEPLRLHQIVEAFHNDGWWSGIVIATDPLVVAFPITREAIVFPPSLVRPRRDYVEGQWIRSQDVIAVQPQREVKVYDVSEKVEVVRDREVFGYSWFPATVVKVIDNLSYLVEYFDSNVIEGREKSTEYVHCMFIRPAVEHCARESEFHLGPGAVVEAYCDGAWSPGVVVRSVAEGAYEVRIRGKDNELLKVPKFLKPHYLWNGKHWKIVSRKRQASRRLSLSGKRPSSPVEVVSSDDKHGYDAGSSTKRSRKELPQQELEVVLTNCSEHVPDTEMETTLSALRKSLASGYSSKFRSPLPGKNNFQVIPRSIVSTSAIQTNHSELLCASVEYPRLGNELIRDGTGEVANQEIISDMMFSDGQHSTPFCGPSAHEALITVLRYQKKDSCCVNNSSQQTHKRPPSAQAPLLKHCNLKHKGVELHSIETLQGKSVASDNVKTRLKVKNSMSVKGVVCALSSPTCNTPALLNKKIRMSDVVSGETGSGSDTNVFLPEKSADVGFKDLSTPHGLVDATIATKKRSRKKVAGRLKEISVDRQLELRGSCNQQDLNRDLDDMMNTNEGTDKVLLPLIPLGFKSLCNEKGCLDGGEVDEGPAQLNFWNDENSQCTPDSTLLRSCLQSGSVGDEDLFTKTSPMWHQAQTMEVFQDVRPHFLPLKQYEPEFREGMALGLMFNYIKLVNDIRGLCITDSMTIFEQKITTLDRLEENGFDVNFLRHTLSRLIQNKHDHTRHLNRLNEMKELIPGKESSVSQIYSVLDEKHKAIFDLEQKLEFLRGEAEQIVMEKCVKDVELSMLKSDISNAQEECGDDELRFNNVLVDMCSNVRLK